MESSERVVGADVLEFLNAVSVRARNAVVEGVERGTFELRSLSELHTVTAEDLLCLRNFGQVGFRRLVCEARDRGIKLHPTCENAVPACLPSGDLSKDLRKAYAALARARVAIGQAEVWLKRAAKGARW